MKRTNWNTTTRVDQNTSTPSPLPPVANAEISAALSSHMENVQLGGASGGRPIRLEQYPTGVQEWVKESIQISDRTAQQGNFRQAIAIHEQILKIVPQHAQSLLRLGELYFAAGRYNLAIEWFTKGTISSPDVLFEMG
jgi:tetratricopeptide (TPR) repeat protein